MRPYWYEWDKDGYSLVPLRPTGRWREKKDDMGNTIMFIEHRYYLFFKKWIHEKLIEFREEPEDVIYSCKGMR